MEIRIHQLLKGAKEACGLAVIIDVFRAFSTACYIFSRGAERIYPVAEIGEALRLKKVNPEYILIGERNERKPPGFDFGNSPSHLMDTELSGKIIVHTTSSGTQGIANATGANEIITGSFVNASAIVRFVRETNPSILSLVCMGYACLYPTDEDNLCAEYIRNELEGKPSDFYQMKKLIRMGSGSRFFSSESQEWAPFSDFELCLDLNRFDFILRAEKEKELTFLKKVDV